VDALTRHESANSRTETGDRDFANGADERTRRAFESHPWLFFPVSIRALRAIRGSSFSKRSFVLLRRVATFSDPPPASTVDALRGQKIQNLQF